jgi:hypothetical protein
MLWRIERSAALWRSRRAQPGLAESTVGAAFVAWNSPELPNNARVNKRRKRPTTLKKCRPQRLVGSFEKAWKKLSCHLANTERERRAFTSRQR